MFEKFSYLCIGWTPVGQLICKVYAIDSGSAMWWLLLGIPGSCAILIFLGAGVLLLVLLLIALAAPTA